MKKTLISNLILISLILTGCSSTNSSISNNNTKTGSNTSINETAKTAVNTGNFDIPEEAKTLIDQIMAAKQKGDNETATKIQAELETKFPNLPKPGQNKTGVVASGGTSALDTSNIKTKYLDVKYGTDSDTQQLDIYLPEGKGPFPVIVAIHGGGFMMGSKEGGDLKSMLKGVDRGYAVVTVNYRMSNEAIFPAAINDIQKAITFIKQNATTYNFNGNKIATWGDSAGGNLASLAGTMGTGETKINAVVDWFGPIYFSTMDEQFKELGVTPKMGNTNNNNSPESKYIGKTIGTEEAETLVKQASPQTYITQESPAFYIQHGTLDTNIPITQSENFAKALQDEIGTEKVIFEKIEGAAHGGSQFETEENLNNIFNFLDKYLK